ncbi:MAG: DUF397 domain-containing protein [Streptosporangiales bacterium]|jgi:hypothetical protein|nr:DUF397 domain-containing protein [Streptosporangiales bacterium]
MGSEWRKSSYSGGSSNACVECGTGAGTVLVRDTANRDGAILTMTAAAWSRFAAAIR